MIDYNNIKHTCSNCGKPVNKNASKCPHCGVKLAGRVWKDGINPFEEEYKYNLNKAQRRENTKNNLINLARDGLCCIITLFIALFGIIAGIFFFKRGEKISGGILIILGAIMLILRIIATSNGMPAHYILIFTPGYP